MKWWAVYWLQRGSLRKLRSDCSFFSLAWLVHRDLMILSDKWNKFVGFSNPFNLPSNKIQQNIWKLLFFMKIYIIWRFHYQMILFPSVLLTYDILHISKNELLFSSQLLQGCNDNSVMESTFALVLICSRNTIVLWWVFLEVVVVYPTLVLNCCKTRLPRVFRTIKQHVISARDLVQCGPLWIFLVLDLQN